MPLRSTHALLAAAAVTALLAAPRAEAQLHVGATAGASYAFGQTYFSLGGHLGYGVGFGLEPNVEAQWWLGQSPTIVKLAPGITWYLPLPLIRPYVGGYYARWIVSSGVSDQDALGARAGLVVFSAGPASAGLGVAYERRLSCNVNCDTWLPEASAGITF